LFRADETIALWRQVRAEVLWVEGTESELVEALRGHEGGMEDRLSALQNLVDMKRIEGAVHNIHHDRPEKLAPIIDDFMRPRGVR
jgi:pimeloyl-ACP methyl ester carboxylesterase